MHEPGPDIQTSTRKEKTKRNQAVQITENTITSREFTGELGLSLGFCSNNIFTDGEQTPP